MIGSANSHLLVTKQKKGFCLPSTTKAKHKRQRLVRMEEVLCGCCTIWENDRRCLKALFSAKHKVQLSSARPKQKTVPRVPAPL